MISAFAKAAQHLDDPRYLKPPLARCRFILDSMYDRARKTLLRRYRAGEAAIPGFLDDYAFLIAALLDLYEADFDPRHIELALALTVENARTFRRSGQRRILQHCRRRRSLVIRIKDDYDGAEPSGNSFAASRSAPPGPYHGSARLRESAERTLSALGPKMRCAAGRVSADAGGARLLIPRAAK